MSICSSTSTPVDVCMSNVVGNCKLKCAFSFQYSILGNITIKNNGDYLSLSSTTQSTGTIKFNETDYTLQEVRIYQPSIHTYDGVSADAEMILVHTPQAGTASLLVCVPIKATNASTNASSSLTNIITSAKMITPSSYVSSDSANLQTTNLTMNYFIPNTAFYNYTGALPYENCDTVAQFVVFSPNTTNAYIDATVETMNIIQKIITPHNYTVKTPGADLFYNSSGPQSGEDTGNQIYIDCQPVGVSSETTNITIQKTTTSSKSGSGGSINIQEIIASPAFKILVSAIVFIILIVIFKYFLRMVSAE